MAIEIKVPALGESVTEATVGQWFKQPGDPVAVDEPVVELETDKVTIEVPAPSAGVLAAIKVPQGSTVAVGTVLGAIANAGAQPGPSNEGAALPASAPQANAAGACVSAAAGGGPAPRACRRAGRDRRRRHAAGSRRAQDHGGKGPCRRRRCWLRPSRPDPEGGCHRRPTAQRPRTRQRRLRPRPSAAICRPACPLPPSSCAHRPVRTMPRAKSACA